MAAAPLTIRLRKLWLDIHLWIGVGLLIAILPLSATGAALVWRDGLDKVFNPQRYAVSGAATRPLADYLAAGATAIGGEGAVTGVRLPAGVDEPVIVTARGRGAGEGGRPRNVSIWLDPTTLAVKDIGSARGGAMQVMHELHGTLLIPGIGRKVVGWVGWAMTLSCLTGLWLWWPRNGAFLPGLRWTRGSGVLFNLHHMVGFWICLPLLVLSLTGVYLSFPQTARALFGIEAQQPPQGGGAPKVAPRGPGGPGGGSGAPLANPHLTPTAAAGAARALVPGGSLLSLNLPTAGRKPAWRAQVRTTPGGEPIFVEINDATGRAAIATKGQGIQDPLSRWMRRLHDGGNLPLVWKWVITLGGVAPVILCLTGLVMWLQSRARKARLRPVKVAA
ncbi:MAG: PepSY-associated TM helix domain-containing protein [Caulobacteraceae bacterium]